MEHGARSRSLPWRPRPRCTVCYVEHCPKATLSLRNVRQSQICFSYRYTPSLSTHTRGITTTPSLSFFEVELVFSSSRQINNILPSSSNLVYIFYILISIFPPAGLLYWRCCRGRLFYPTPSLHWHYFYCWGLSFAGLRARPLWRSRTGSIGDHRNGWCVLWRSSPPGPEAVCVRCLVCKMEEWR